MIVRRPIRTLKPEVSGLRNFLAGYDFSQIVALLGLLAAGLTFIYSTGLQVGGVQAEGFFYKQLFWLGVSFPVYLFFAHFDYRHLRLLSVIFYLLCIGCLVLVLLFGVKIYGARRWLDLGSFNFQPSELTKLALVMLLAALFSLPKFDINRIHWLILAGLLTIIPFGLIFIEPDLGSAMVLLPLVLSMVFIAGISKKNILFWSVLILLLGGLFTANELWGPDPILKEYHHNRINAFLNPENAPKDMTYQQRQAELAVGSGGLWGKGIGQGTQHTLGFLPQSAANNDFIFSVIAEETGFAGCLLVLLFFAILLYGIFYTAYRTQEPFGRFLAVGIGMLFFTHMFINIGVNIGLAPVTGLPLPFVSYGGSFLLAGFAALGIVQSIHRYGVNRD